MTKYRNPLPTTDIIIEYDDGIKQGIVLVERRNPPYGLAIPGGFAEYGLTLEDNARKEAKEETGLEIEIKNPGRPWVYSNPNRDPRCHTITNVFLAKGRGKLNAGDDAKDAKIYTLYEVESLIKNNRFAFDHGVILQLYLIDRGDYYPK